MYLQRKWRAMKERPKKLDVRRFKDLFYSTLIGWRIRRIISYMKTLPEIKEAIDYVKLKSDLDNSPNDMFSRQIIAQFPEKIIIFHEKFEDLYENAIWIKKPNVKSPQRNKKAFIKANSRGNNFNRTLKPSRGTQKKEIKVPAQKAPLHKAKTFKKPKKQNISMSKEISDPSANVRKYPTE